MAGRKRTANYEKIHELKDAGKKPAEIAKSLHVSTATVSRALKVETMAAVKGGYGEMGVTGLNRFGGAISEDYVQDWNSLPRMVKTVRRMLDHPIVAAVAFAVEMLVRSATLHVEPASEEKADIDAADFLDTCIHDMSHSWSEHMAQAISMAWYGFAPFETVYKRRLGSERDPASKHDDGRIGWRKFGYRSPDTLTPGKEWQFDDNGGVQGMNQTPLTGGGPRFIPIEKMVLYRTGAMKNNPQGRSALRGAYQPWYFSKNFAEVEGIAAERMGTGMPIMYLGKGTRLEGANSDFSKAQDIVRNTRTDEQMGIVIPYPKMTSDGVGALFELISPPSRGMIDFAEAINRYNQQIAQVLLAQFIFFGLSERGTQALAVRTTDFFAQAVSGWLDNMAETFNRFAVDRLFRLNAAAFPGITQYPEIEFAAIDQGDVAGIMKALNDAVSARALTPDDGVERKVRELLDLPEMDEATLRPAPAPVIFGKPQGQPTDDPKLDVAEGGKTPEDEAFAASRFRGPRSRRTWEKETNKYQVQIQLIYDKWLRDLAAELQEADTEERDEIVADELAVLASALAAAGRMAIVNGANLGLGNRPPSPEYLAEIARRVQQNDDYLATSFMPAAKSRLESALRDEDVIAAGVLGLIGYMSALGSRAEQYAGAMWTAIQMGAGVAMTQAQAEGEIIAIRWDLDEQAQHCDDCPEFAGEYESMDDLMATTGNRLPGEVQCDGNCRCSLWGQLVDGTWIRI